jgi:hypothetical protein
VLHEDDIILPATDHRPLFTVHHFLPSVCVFLLKVRFRPPKCPFKALFNPFFKRFINHIKLFLWPDPHFNPHFTILYRKNPRMTNQFRK